MAPSPVLEVCVETAAGARAALAGGADRVELASDLLRGGVTPGPGAIRAALAIAGIELVVLVRPRPGGFAYGADERETCRRDVEFARAAGAHAVALGALEPSGRIDRAATAELVALARPMQVAFHRAFDDARDGDEALDDLLELGVDRVLTSGGAPRAEDGLARLARLVERAGAALEVVVAGGVRAHNARRIVEATGARALHFRADAPAPSAGGASLAPGLDPDLVERAVDPELVRAVRAALA